jgi:hypothetical protein
MRAPMCQRSAGEGESVLGPTHHGANLPLGGHGVNRHISAVVSGVWPSDGARSTKPYRIPRAGGGALPIPTPHLSKAGLGAVRNPLRIRGLRARYSMGTLIYEMPSLF